MNDPLRNEPSLANVLACIVRAVFLDAVPVCGSSVRTSAANFRGMHIVRKAMNANPL